MALVSVRIPQIGEGLQEARLVAVLKQPGDPVRRDEPIYQMETDKAVMDVESPYEGTLVEWLGKPDDILAIGAEVARMEVPNATADAPPAHSTTAEGTAENPALTITPEPAAAGNRLAGIPPRTRAYAKERGLDDAQVAEIKPLGSKLMPEDIDAYIAAKSSGESPDYTDAKLSGKQRLLANRLQRGSQLVVPGTMSVVCRWEGVERARAAQRAAGGDFQPSAFTMFAYAVARALADHPMFRSSLIGESDVRTYAHTNLGIAVGLPGDELVIALVERADTLTWTEFARESRARIDMARTGVDQANETMTISLTNMQAFGLRDAVPVVVPPAVATLFLGEPYITHTEEHGVIQPARAVNLALTFDHRLINGVGAAHFLNAVKSAVEKIEELVSA